MESISIIEHTLENHTGFHGKHTVQLVPDASTVVFGINGAGKTSLLDSIYFTVYRLGKEIGISEHKNLTGITSSSTSIYALTSKHLSKCVWKNTEFRITLLNNDGNYSLVDYNTYKNILGDNYYFPKQYLPIFRYFRTNKLIDNKQTTITNQKVNQIEDRKIGYTNHNSEYLSIQEVTNFIINQINIENQAKVDREDFKYESPKAVYIRKVLNQFTTALYGDSVTVKVGASKYSSGQSLIIKKGDEELEFLQLSSGEKYVFAVVLELIYRNCILNSNVDDLHIAPGIVLIDEIESHLHPKWQLTILKTLEVAFPNVQFIVSSHSPLIASSVKREQIVVLNDFEIIPSSEFPDLYSGTANETLDKILFSDYQISDFDEEKEEIDQLLKSFEYEAAENKLNALKEKVGATPKWIKDYERTISFNRA